MDPLIPPAPPTPAAPAPFPPGSAPPPLPPAKKKNWGLRIFLGILGLLFVGFVGLIAILFFSLRGKMRGAPAEPGEAVRAGSADTLVVRFNAPMRDEPPAPIAMVFGGGWTTPHQVVTAIDKAARDPRIKRILVIPGLGMLPGWAKTGEIRDALLDARKAGKQVRGFAEFADMQGYWLLSACDDITMPEGGDLLVNGFLAQFPLYKGPLTKLGVQPEFIHAGKYKSYSEAFMNDDISPENREQMDEMVESLYGRFVEGVASSRKLAPEAVKAQIDHAFFVAPDALAGKLIDKVAYYDQFEASLGKLKKISVRRYLGLLDNPGAPSALPDEPHVAVLHATGGIVSGERQQGPFSDGESIASDTFIHDLRMVGENKNARVLLLAVDSPGGSALASDVMWRELKRLREEKRKKVIVTMGNVAASGGYYMAMGGDRVFASPMTITGSIGVVSGKFNVAELYGKVGYKKVPVMRGANADLFVEYQPLRPEQQQILLGNMETTYKQFVSRVSENRKLSFEQVDALAQGRVYTGLIAKTHALVDEIGGYREALAYARKEAGLPADAPAVEYPPQKDFFAALFNKGNDQAEARALAALPAEMREALAQSAALERLAREPLLLYEPLRISGNPR